MKKSLFITIALTACMASNQEKGSILAGEMFFEQDSSDGICQAVWSYSGDEASLDCPNCQYEPLWVYNISFEAESQIIPNDCMGSRIAEYGADPSEQTELLNQYSHLIGYTESVPNQDGGVILFGHTTEDGPNLVPFASAEWVSDTEITWSRMGPNQVITERGIGRLTTQ